MLFIHCFYGSILLHSDCTCFEWSGWKPLRFVSLICRKSSSESAEEIQRKRGKIPNPQTGTTKQSLKKTTPSNKDDRESCSFPSRSTSSFVEHHSITADAVVTVCLPLNVSAFLRCEKRWIVSGVSRGHAVLRLWEIRLLQWMDPNLCMSRRLKRELSCFLCAHVSLNALVSWRVVAHFSTLLLLHKLHKVCTFLQDLGKAVRASADNY